jgi:SWI/SNF-related matrix-associated actin-dependent regulator of chromatin subfamily A member 5
VRGRFDFQFFNKKRIEELIAEENELLSQKRTLLNLAREAKSREVRDHKRVVKQRATELMEAAAASAAGSSLTESAALEAAEAEWVAAESNLESAVLERDAEKLDFSAEKRAEKERLLAEGFPLWTRRDHKAFLVACERFLSDQREAIIREVQETADKPASEVQRYYDVFWSKGPEQLPEWRKIEEKIGRARSQLERRDAISRVVRDLVGREVAAKLDPFKTVAVPYHAASKPPPVKGFSEEEDRWLVCMINALGYGNWEALKDEVRKAPCFQFNWFMRSRSAVDLQRRCDTLVRL